MHVHPRFLHFVVLLALAPLGLLAGADDFFSWGNVCTEQRDARWSFTYGMVADMNGDVTETTRPYYDAVGRSADNALAERYSLADFDIDSGYSLFGVQFDKHYRFFSFHGSLSLLDLSTSTTAKRHYYLSVYDDIDYGGQTYDHLMIRDGQPFDAEFFGGILGLSFDFTPFTLSFAEWARIAPFVDIGLMGIVGQYEIDAGNPVGTTVYQNPPVDFVVGGHAESLIGIGAPQVGFGGEFTLGWDDGLQWVNRVGFDFFAYDGDTDLLTSSKHRSKRADVTLTTLTWESTVLIPLESLRALSVGLRIQAMEFDGSITSDAKDTKTVIARRERFNKDIAFDMATVLLTAGFTF
ncbi:MAG: hypothetical protein ACOX5G_10365 [Kiritimatiellia bacterium]|jgi:hypothetical protein